MKTTEILAIERALNAIQLVFDSGYGDDGPLRGFDLTHLDDLPQGDQDPVRRSFRDAAQQRAAIHLCLTSAGRLLGVAHRLMTVPAYHIPKGRDDHLRVLVDDIRFGARTAYQAALILLSEDPVLISMESQPGDSPPRY